MNEEMRQRILINKKGTIRDPVQAAASSGMNIPFPDGSEVMKFDLSAIKNGLEKNASAELNLEIETSPRETVKRMLEEKKYDEPFVFKTYLGQGANHVQAMRQVLSRTRKKALRKRIRLEEFKLFELAIESKEDHDVVRLMRTRQIPKHLTSVYDDLIVAFEKKAIVPTQERTS